MYLNSFSADQGIRTKYFPCVVIKRLAIGKFCFHFVVRNNVHRAEVSQTAEAHSCFRSILND